MTVNPGNLGRENKFSYQGGMKVKKAVYHLLLRRGYHIAVNLKLKQFDILTVITNNKSRFYLQINFFLN